MTDRERSSPAEDMVSETTFEEIYRDKYHGVYTKALQIIRNPEDAEEVAQDILLAVWQNQKTLNERMDGWIGQRTKYRSIDRLRRLRALPVIAEKAVEDLQLYDETENPESLFINYEDAHERVHLLNEVLAHLTPIQRQILLSVNFEEHPYVVAAKRAHVKLDTAKSIIHRSKIKARKYLEDKR